MQLSLSGVIDFEVARLSKMKSSDVTFGYPQVILEQDMLKLQQQAAHGVVAELLVFAICCH